jgi:CheY-like chemotaxis protein
MSTVLLVERDPAFRGFLRRQIPTRYDILEAACPVEAMDIFRTCREIDVLLCDADLGLVSGMELASLLRAWNTGLRTILLTDLPCDQWTRRQEMELKELPVDDVLILEKPFKAMELHAALATLVFSMALA